MRLHAFLFTQLLAVCLMSAQSVRAAEPWVIDTQEEWTSGLGDSENCEFKDGMATPTAKQATLRSVVKSFDSPRSPKSLVVEQSPVWQNWEPIENVGPSNLADAPVLLSLGPDNYWIFGRYGGARQRAGGKNANFKPEPAKLEGFDVPLQTTRFPNQYDAPGGLKKGLGGYHAWQSRDMKNWVHHGPVTEGFSRWVTTAEFVDGAAYIYYDYPNDQDPHVYVDRDLFDGEPGENMGMAFKDPSHGSDCGIIRDLEGNFNVIYEDWSPISANKRSWDSPLAGRAVSKDGLKNFEIQSAVVDHRTEPTGEIGTYKHPHWLQHPDFKTNIAEYEIHEPEQNAYGDWAAISIGGQYYLFGDFDPAGGHSMSACWFTSPSLEQEFEFCGNIGKGHPDPDVCFAEGQFYLVTQMKTDYVSPGPWVETVEARAGVDTTGDGKIDQWTEWQELSESYDYTPGFAKQVQKTPAALDLSSLPEGHAFQFEVKLTDSTENESKPILDRITLQFDK